MIQYKLIKLNNEALTILGKDKWILSTIYNDVMYFYREVKKRRSEKNLLQTPQYLEFKEKYPSKTGIYDDKLIIKYNKLVEEGLHTQIINSIEMYKKEIEITGKPVANASTFLNQKRWNEKFKVIKNKNEEWQNELLKDLPIKIIEQVIEKKKEWESTMKKDISEGVFKNIIEKFNI